MKNSIPNKWIKAVLYSAIGLAVVIIAITLYRKPALEDLGTSVGRTLSPPVKIPSFELVDHRGRPFNNDSLKGNWNLAMIGFTYCPDVCPTSLSKIAAFFHKLETLPGDDKAPGFVFISVDPFRDTPEVLGNYVGYFRKDFTGVTGTPEKINKLTIGLGLYYKYTDQEDDHLLDDVLHKPDMNDYGVVHSSTILFISPRADLAGILSQPFEPDDVLSLYARLRDYYGDER